MSLRHQIKIWVNQKPVRKIDMTESEGLDESACYNRQVMELTNIDIF
jgi:hypothetical protein